MTKTNAIKLFEDKKVRSIWDDETEEWYFCIIDVISSLTDTVNPTDYIKKMKKRDEMLAKGWGQIVTPFLFRLRVVNKKSTLLMQKAYFVSYNQFLHLKLNLLNNGWHRSPQKE